MYGLVVVLVEKCFDVVVFLMYYDNCIFFYVGVKEIIGFWDLVFVGEKQLVMVENMFKFQLVNVWVGINMWSDFIVLGVNQLVNV